MFVADFEKGLWNALRQLFLGIPIKGCVFHWCQAIFRKIQKSGLAVSYNSTGNTYTFLRKLMALPFLSREHKPLAFNKLKDTAQGRLQTVVRYEENMLDFQSSLPNRQLVCLSSSHPDKQRH
jgi:hypothetical protein